MSKARQLAELGNAFDDGALSNRNLIINGAMQVAQRGEQTGLSSSYTVDRWNFFTNSAARITADQSTDVPSGEGFSNSLHMEVTTADSSVAATDFAAIRTSFEGQNLQHIRKGTSNAKPLTLQFWIKSTVTGTYVVEFYDNDNARQISKNYTVNSANTWEKKTIKIPADTTGALDNDNNNSFLVQFGLLQGSNFTSGTLETSWAAKTDANRYVGQVNALGSTSNNIYITGVQLEVGDTATPFEHRSYGQELTLCKRYYTQGSIQEAGSFRRQAATVASVINYGGHFFYETEMRTDATVTLSNTALNGATAIAVAFQNKTGFVLQMTTSGVNTYYATAGDFTASAEL